MSEAKRLVGGALLAAAFLGTAPAHAASPDAGVVPRAPAFGADLAISVSASTPGPYVAHTFEWTLQITNGGPGAAASLTVTDVVPDLFAVVGVSSNDFTCVAVANSVSCTRAELAAGAGGSIQITAMVPDSLIPQTVTDFASVSALTPDPDPTNNAASSSVLTVVVQVGAPDATTVPPATITTTEPTISTGAPTSSTISSTTSPTDATPTSAAAAPPAAPDFGVALPQTGADLQPLWLLATEALGLGALLTFVNRRRRPA